MSGRSEKGDMDTRCSLQLLSNIHIKGTVPEIKWIFQTITKVQEERTSKLRFTDKVILLLEREVELGKALIL